MMPDLHIYLLGDFRLGLGDEPPIAIHQARQQALLTYLLLHRHAPQSRRHLAFLLWPDSSEAQALTNLRKTLTHLRQIAPILAQSLYADHQVVQWRPLVGFTLDVAEFETKLDQATAAEQAGRAQEAIALWAVAVALYTGPLTPSCYDDWVIAERERLHQLCLGALERLVAGHERQHNLTAAISYAQQLLRLDPLQETVYLQLMRLHLLQGDRAGALRTYHTCVTVLARELGVEPAPETQEAYARLLKLEMGATAAMRVHRATNLVGRQVEWEKLQRTWRLATGQRAHFVCLWGEAGIGKTHLAEALLGWAGQQGFTVARTRAYAGEGQLAYAPVIEWLRSDAVRAVRQRLAPVWRREVARLTPELLSEQPSIPAPDPMTEAWQRQRLWEALARALLAAAQPMLLVIDDLQWCNTETLEWLHYLLHFAPRARLLVLGTARPEEVDDAHPLQTLYRHLRITEQLTEIELGPLNAEQTALLAAQVAQQPLDDNTQQALYHATAGNPLFIVEMTRAGLRNQTADLSLQLPVSSLPLLPPKVQAVIEFRLAQLSLTAHNLAHLAAVIGQAFTFALLFHASGGDEDEAVSALDELWQRRIIRAQGTYTYDFSHDRIRDVAYAELSPVRRRQLHRKAAAALEQMHATELHVVSARIASHYHQAGEPVKAASYYLRAAHEMQFGYTYIEAITHLQQGLTILQNQPRTAENVALAIAMYLALGRSLTAHEMWGSPGTVTAFETARKLAIESNNLPQLVQAQDYLQIAYSESGKLPLALAMAESNLALVARVGKTLEVEGAHGGLGYLLWCIGDFGLARQHLEQAAALAAQLPDIEKNAHSGLSYSGAFPHALVLWLLGYPDTAAHYLQAVLRDQEPQAAPFDRMTGYEFCVMFYHWRREFHQMQTYAQKLLAVTEQYEYTTYRWLGQLYTTAAAAALGQPNAGSLLLRKSIETMQDIGVRMHIPYSLYLLAEMYAQAGQPSEGLATLDEALALAVETGELLWQAETHRLHGDLLYAKGSLQEAELAYQSALVMSRQQCAKSLELRAATSLARLWQQQGRSAEAHQMLTGIYNWFTEGFDTADLQTAKALLLQLQAA